MQYLHVEDPNVRGMLGHQEACVELPCHNKLQVHTVNNIWISQNLLNVNDVDKIFDGTEAQLTFEIRFCSPC